MSRDYLTELKDNVKKLTAIGAGLQELGKKTDSFCDPFDQRAVYGFGLYLEDMVEELQEMYDDIYNDLFGNPEETKALTTKPLSKEGEGLSGREETVQDKE